MSHNTLLLLSAALAVVALIVLIARFKLHPFVVLITVSLALGAAAGMPLGSVVKAFQDGVGGVLGFVAIVVALGTIPPSGLSALLKRGPSEPSFAASGALHDLLAADGFRPVRTLAEREGLIFIEAAKPRDEGEGKAGRAGTAGRAG